MYIKRFLPALLALVMIVVLLIWVFSSCSRTPKEDASIQRGIEFLQEQEAKDPQEVVKALRAQGQDATIPSSTSDGNDTDPDADAAAQREEEREALRQKIENGEVDVWTLFDEYVILGDSRAVGFYYFDFLDKSRTLADGGHTIRDVEPQLDDIVALNPKHIYLCYGLNDVSIGYWDTPEEYVAEMREVIEMLQEALPEATVVVSSILPARDPAFDLSSKWYHIPEFSAAVEELCAEMGVAFANNDAICETYAEYWQPDGIHVRPEFYPYWATNLIIATMRGDAGDV